MVLVAIGVAAPLFAQSPFRRWNDSTGRFSVTARFVDLDDDSVALQSADEQLLTIPISRLSAKDREYINSPRGTLERLGAKIRTGAGQIDQVLFVTPGDELCGLWMEHVIERNSRVSDDDIAVLQELAYLVNLDLSFTGITDETLEKLQATSLRSLSLRSTRISDRGLSAISSLDQLEELDLSGTATSDEGVLHLRLSELHGLRRLSLAGTEITDAALKRLAATELRSLDLSYTDVTDDGLVDLENLKKLQHLMLLSTDCSDAGLANLQTSLPNCIVETTTAWIRRR